MLQVEGAGSSICNYYQHIHLVFIALELTVPTLNQTNIITKYPTGHFN